MPMTTPTTMRAAQAASFGPADKVLTVCDGIPVPVLTSPSTLLVKVHAVSLSPSDYRTLHGETRLVKPPPDTKWPYIPGGDLCGTVIQTTPEETKFKLGDQVIATWHMYGLGGLAEYAIVETQWTELKPDSVNFLQAAALADSSVNAMLALEDINMKRGERVLVLGGSGGMGTSVVQLAKDIGAYVVTTSTDEKLVKECGADEVVNYKQMNWWEMQRFKEQPFDVVIDCAEGCVAWERVLRSGVVKSRKDGGRFLAVVVNEWHIEVNNFVQGAVWMSRAKWREAWSHLLGTSRPAYQILMPAPRGRSLKRLLEKVEQGKLHVVLDASSPFAFTTEGVREAFELMVSRRAHGKIVIGISEQ